jgi:hypothetical protein
MIFFVIVFVIEIEFFIITLTNIWKLDVIKKEMVAF